MLLEKGDLITHRLFKRLANINIEMADIVLFERGFRAELMRQLNRCRSRCHGVAQTGLSLGSGVGELAKPSGRRLDLGRGGGKNFASIT